MAALNIGYNFACTIVLFIYLAIAWTNVIFMRPTSFFNSYYFNIRYSRDC